ncbi:MAG: hypothetical protein AAB365_02445 [Patescibacteria group bacterium]
MNMLVKLFAEGVDADYGLEKGSEFRAKFPERLEDEVPFGTLMSALREIVPGEKKCTD